MNAKILIADDESDIVSMLGSFFESKGFRVLPAAGFYRACSCGYHHACSDFLRRV